jgi:hypothetical protein
MALDAPLNGQHQPTPNLIDAQRQSKRRKNLMVAAKPAITAHVATKDSHPD